MPSILLNVFIVHHKYFALFSWKAYRNRVYFYHWSIKFLQTHSVFIGAQYTCWYILWVFFFFLKDFLIYLFIYLFLAVLGLRFARGLSPVAASRGHSSSRCGDRSSSRCAGLSLPRPLPSWGTGSRRAGSAIVAHGPSCSAARGIFPDQGSNPRPLH